MDFNGQAKPSKPQMQLKAPKLAPQKAGKCPVPVLGQMPCYRLAGWQRYQDTSAPSLAQHTVLLLTGGILLAGRQQGFQQTKAAGNGQGARSFLQPGLEGLCCQWPLHTSAGLCRAMLSPSGSICSHSVFTPCPAPWVIKLCHPKPTCL